MTNKFWTALLFTCAVLSLALSAQMARLLGAAEGNLRSVNDQLELANNAIAAFRLNVWIRPCSDVGLALNLYDHRRWPETPLTKCSDKERSSGGWCCVPFIAVERAIP